MNKTISTPICSILLWSITVVVLAGCGAETLTNTAVSPSPIASHTSTSVSPTVAHLKITSIPIQSSTATPPYIHYTPSKRFNIHLEFDYPGSWIFSEQKRGAGLMILGLNDPRFLTLPTPSPNDFHPIPNDFASVYIWIYSVENGRTLDTQIGAFKQGSNQTSWATFLDDYKITIDGYDARVLEYQVNDPESSPSLMFERSTFFVAEDQIYEIFFTIAEKDRNGEFEKGYEYFFNSLKIVP